MQIEHKTCGLIELKFAQSEAGSMEFSGYGAVFKNVDKGGDVIEQQAFDQFLSDVKSGAQEWPAMLSQHGAMGLTTEDLTPVGVWTDMQVDSHGLKMSGVLADTERGTELYKLMKMKPRPAINGLSIGYVTRDASPGGKDSNARRILKQVDLIEISPVTFPMNGKARIGNVKSAYDFNEREFEQFLRDSAGLSRKDAQTVISKGFRSIIAERDSGNEELKQILAQIERSNSIFQQN